MNEAARDLDRALIKAHARGDISELIRLYTRAGDASEAIGDIDAACFYLTHAYVFALQEGDGAAADLNIRLVEHGRETLQPDLSSK